MGKEICQLRLGLGEVPGPLNPNTAWLCKVTYVESCSCAWNSLVCRVTPVISKAMSSSICHDGQGGREGCLGPRRGDALGRGLNTMLDRFSGLFFPRSWVRVLHLPTHLHSCAFPVTSPRPLSSSLSVTTRLLLSYMTLSQLLKLSKPVFPSVKASATSEGCRITVI